MPPRARRKIEVGTIAIEHRGRLVIEVAAGAHVTINILAARERPKRRARNKRKDRRV